jgi:hypothetical protein
VGVFFLKQYHDSFAPTALNRVGLVPDLLMGTFFSVLHHKVHNPSISFRLSSAASATIKERCCWCLNFSHHSLPSALIHIIIAAMADYNFGGSEEENAELKKLENELVREDQLFDAVSVIAYVTYHLLC